MNRRSIKGIAVCLMTCSLCSEAQADWTKLSIPVGVEGFASSDTSIYGACGTNGVYRSDDHGETWHTANGGLSLFNTGVEVLGVYRRDVFVGLFERSIYRLVNEAEPWQETIGWFSVFYRAFANMGQDFYVGGLYGAARWDTASLRWHELVNAPPQVTSFATDDSFLYVGVYHPEETTGVYRSSDRGESWVRLIDGLPEVPRVIGVIRVGQTLLAVTYTDGVYRSENRGLHWFAEQPNLGTAIPCPYAVSGEKLFLGTTASGVLLSTNRGATFTPVNEGLGASGVKCMQIVGADLFIGNGAGAWRRPLSEMNAPCCVGTRGNVNMVGIVDLSDLSALVSYLTGGGYVLPCPDEANFDAAGIVDLTDLSMMVVYLTSQIDGPKVCP